MGFGPCVLGHVTGQGRFGQAAAHEDFLTVLADLDRLDGAPAGRHPGRRRHVPTRPPDQRDGKGDGAAQRVQSRRSCRYLGVGAIRLSSALKGGTKCCSRLCERFACLSFMGRGGGMYPRFVPPSFGSEDVNNDCSVVAAEAPVDRSAAGLVGLVVGSVVLNHADRCQLLRLDKSPKVTNALDPIRDSTPVTRTTLPLVQPSSPAAVTSSSRAAATLSSSRAVSSYRKTAGRQAAPSTALHPHYGWLRRPARR